MKYLLLLTVILISFGLVGCSDTSPLAPEGQGSDSEDVVGVDAAIALITYDIEMDSSKYNYADRTTTFFYSVTSNPRGGNEIDHWNIELPAIMLDNVILLSASEKCSWVNQDPSTYIHGIRFETEYMAQESRNVSFTLNGYWTVDRVRIAVQSGIDYVYDYVLGPAERSIPAQLYTIDGFVYYDVNENGIMDLGEQGMPDIQLTLADGSTALSNEIGYYQFAELMPGEYSVSVESPDGFISTTSASVQVAIEDMSANASFGLAINFDSFNGQAEGCHSIGFWKNNIRKAMSGRSRGMQISPDTLQEYIGTLSNFQLDPLNFTSLGDAYSTMTAHSRDAVNNLAKHLTASEFNYLNGAYIDGNQYITYALIYWGEYILDNASEYSRSEILAVKDVFEAYNSNRSCER